MVKDTLMDDPLSYKFDQSDWEALKKNHDIKAR